MEIRRAELKDKKNILDIINLLRLDVSDFVWGDADFVEKQIQNGEYFLAENRGFVAGVMSLRQRQDRLYVETLAVIEKSRKRGIGTMLVEQAKKVAKEKKITILCACSFFDYNASEFWIGQGFSLSGKPGKYGGRKFYRFARNV